MSVVSKKGDSSLVFAELYVHKSDGVIEFRTHKKVEGKWVIDQTFDRAVGHFVGPIRFFTKEWGEGSKKRTDEWFSFKISGEKEDVVIQCRQDSFGNSILNTLLSIENETISELKIDLAFNKRGYPAMYITYIILNRTCPYFYASI